MYSVYSWNSVRECWHWMQSFASESQAYEYATAMSRNWFTVQVFYQPLNSQLWRNQMPDSHFQNARANAGFATGILGASVGVINLIWNAQRNDNDKRSAFTQRMIAELSQNFPDENFVITHHRSSTAEGPCVTHQHVELPMIVGTCGYEIFASPKGQPFRFELNGDGGYINWAFGGEFHRDGNTLTAG
jgi:hypothetical protein